MPEFFRAKPSRIKTCTAAALVAAVLAGPIQTQTATVEPGGTTAEDVQAPMQVPEKAPPGSSTPTSMAVGSGAAMIVIALGILAISSVAFMGP
jgi:hypothetical protein